MKFVLRPRAVALAFLLALAACLPYLATTAGRQDFFFLEAKLASNVPGSCQFFYDVGHGVREEDSTRQMLPGDGRPAAYRFPLPTGHYRGLRFDPLDVEAIVSFADVRVVDRFGRVLRRFSSAQFHAENDILSVVPKGAGLEMRAEPGGNDPYFLVDFGPPLDLHIGPRYFLRALSPVFLAVFLGVLAVAALPVEKLRSGRLAAWARAHPCRAIAALSALIVALACHPVIFFGKSFVSPDYGSLLLYEYPPTLPGDPHPQIENPHRSDVGAMMWWHLYCPILAHDALLRDHEVPRWNRYSMSGLPLLGQGQSMFGDPLNWLTIFARGAAWAWDVRFILGRWLLCCGLGLAAWALTRSLWAGALVAAGAGFLGIFEFRVNHAANFSLGYSPWILFAWTGLNAAAAWPGRARWCLLLLLANFATMTSGTVKEAYMLIACLNLAGVALVVCADQTWRRRWQTFLLAAGTGGTLLLLTAPLWLSFCFALKHSWTSYDQPGASQIRPALAIGFFEDLFSRQLQADEGVYMPATNFLYLAGLLAALACWRESLSRRTFVALGLATLLPLSVVFGFIPEGAILSLPFIGNIVAVDNAFSCPLIILTAVLAGFGFAGCFGALRRSRGSADLALFVLLFAGLAALFLGSTQTTPKSPFFTGYAWSLALTLVALPAGLRLATRRQDAGLALALLLFGSILLTWRHGQYLRTDFDNYVLNPAARIPLHPPSPAVDFVSARMREPSRPLGLGLNLFPGYNQMLGWESILGVDPLRNRYHDQLAAAFGIDRVRFADDFIAEASTPALLPGLDLMNVRYYLASHRGQEHPLAPLHLLGSFDFDVFESETAWPRAFFTDRLGQYENAAQFAATVRAGDRRPLAAVERGDSKVPAAAAALSPDFAGRTVRAADAYRLTTNTTSFHVLAPSPGVIVLAETYYPHDFRVTVNGKPQAYFRVNHAYKGIYVDAPGEYRVEFTYRQPGQGASLALAAAGLAALASLGWLATRRVPAAAGFASA